MDVEILKGFFRIGVFIGGCGFVLIFFQPPNSAEFVVSVCSTMIGLLIMLGVVVLMRRLGTNDETALR